MKATGLVLLVLFLIGQFFRPELNQSSEPHPDAMASRFPVPSEVSSILSRSCNDCHSENTAYPWYAHLQPVGWWLADHIDEAKGHFNTDRFLQLSLRRQYHTFEEIREMIELDEMPLPSYLIIHRDAVLSPGDTALLLAWSDAMRDTMAAWYPPDSLYRRGR